MENVLRSKISIKKKIDIYIYSVLFVLFFFCIDTKSISIGNISISIK